MVTPVLGVLIALISQIDITEALKDGYMQSFVAFIGNYFLLFLFGAIFGKVMEDSGAATSIARGILKVTGEKSRIAVIFAMVCITGLLTYGGVSVFVVIFTMIPIARPVFKKLDIPWPIFTGAFFLGMWDLYNDDASGKSANSKFNSDSVSRHNSNGGGFHWNYRNFSRYSFWSMVVVERRQQI